MEENEEKKEEIKAEEVKTEKTTVEKAKEVFTNVADETANYDQKEISDGKAMAILSYIGILALIPFFAEKNNKYVVYHAKQGMNLLITWAGYVVLAILLSLIKVKKVVWFVVVKVTPWWITLPLWLVGLFIGAMAIVGIVYAATGKAKELPLVNKVKVIK